MTCKQVKAAHEPIMAVKHKRDNTIKGQFCTDKRKQWSTKTKAKTELPTIALDFVLISMGLA